MDGRHYEIHSRKRTFFTFRDYYSPFLSTSVRHPYKSYTQMEPPALTENFEKKNKRVQVDVMKYT